MTTSGQKWRRRRVEDLDRPIPKHLEEFLRSCFTDLALAALDQPSNGASLHMRAIGKTVNGCRAVPQVGD
jgi:hypothetical protein